MTPLLYACTECKEAVKLLLDKGADINVKDRNCLTPLHLACKSEFKEAVKYLLKKEVDVNAVTPTIPIFLFL